MPLHPSAMETPPRQGDGTAPSSGGNPEDGLDSMDIGSPKRCRLCAELQPLFTQGMFKHYCKSCSSIRQRGYKRGLTLNDLRNAMQVHGPRNPGRDFLDLAVQVKAECAARQDASLSQIAAGEEVRDDDGGDAPEPRSSRGKGGGDASAPLPGMPSLTKLNTGEKIAAEVLATGVRPEAQVPPPRLPQTIPSYLMCTYVCTASGIACSVRAVPLCLLADADTRSIRRAGADVEPSLRRAYPSVRRVWYGP